LSAASPSTLILQACIRAKYVRLGLTATPIQRRDGQQPDHLHAVRADPAHGCDSRWKMRAALTLEVIRPLHQSRTHRLWPASMPASRMCSGMLASATRIALRPSQRRSSRQPSEQGTARFWLLTERTDHLDSHRVCGIGRAEFPESLLPARPHVEEAARGTLLDAT
jgi:hypothetical protein